MATSGGATGPGVTADEIVLATQPPPDGFSADDEDLVQVTIETLVRYFNERYDFHGRRLRVAVFDPGHPAFAVPMVHDPGDLHTLADVGVIGVLGPQVAIPPGLDADSPFAWGLGHPEDDGRPPTQAIAYEAFKSVEPRLEPSPYLEAVYHSCTWWCSECTAPARRSRRPRSRPPSTTSRPPLGPRACSISAPATTTPSPARGPAPTRRAVDRDAV